MVRGRYRGGGRTGRRRFTAGLGQEDPTKKEGDDDDEGSGEEEEEDESSEEEGEKKHSATEGLIETANPNAVKKTAVKASQIDPDAPVELSRREREIIEKQRAEALHWKLTQQGKTEQAQKDLERLALIRQQREEANKKRAEEKAAQDAKKGAVKK